MPKTSATRRSCWRAMSNGFSRRCETGASREVTRAAPFGFLSKTGMSAQLRSTIRLYLIVKPTQRTVARPGATGYATIFRR
jgi:hypothetical protein